MIKERIMLAIGSLILLAYLSPMFILGEDAHVRIHDHLDSNVIWYKTLVESGITFAPNLSEVPTMMNGLPRMSLPTELELYVLLFHWFEPFTVLTINAFLMRFIAFFGMYLVLKKHVLGPNYGYIAIGAALPFSLLPFWPFGGASIAGVPLALFAFLNIRNRNSSFKDWLIICLLPFYSSLILSFIFFLALMGLLWLGDWIRMKQANWKLFAAIALMTGIYLLKQYRLVSGMLLGKGFTDHRQEFSLGHNSFSRTLGLFWENFTTAHTHSYSLHQPVIWYAVILALLLIMGGAGRSWWKARHSLRFPREEKILPFLFILAAAFSFWYALWYWEGFRLLKNASDLANTFNFGRAHLLNAVIWYMVFAIALVIFHKKLKWFGGLLSVFLVAAQLYVVFNENHELKYQRADSPSFEEFYAESLFDDIKAYIGQDTEDYRIVSIGMYPAVAHYNGMYSLDMYVTTYPLSYKHQFREIIEGELEKNSTLESYYDTWGGRVYVFLDELGKEYLYTKDKEKVVDHLNFGTETFKEMGGDYVLSAVEIENAEENQLRLLEVFENDQSAWRVFLYEAV